MVTEPGKVYCLLLNAKADDTYDPFFATRKHDESREEDSKYK
jgi:hypothetical protein